MEHPIYKEVAELLGWRWSSAHGGWINDKRRDRPGYRPNEWASYYVMNDAEDCCFDAGIETEEEAFQYIEQKVDLENGWI